MKMAGLALTPSASWGLRTRITAWYVLLMAVTLITFSTLLYLRLRHDLVSQVDLHLADASSQAMLSLEPGDGRLVFGHQDIPYVGQVASVTPNSLVLGEGATFEITDETRLTVSPAIGMQVEVDAALVEGVLVALEVDQAEDKAGGSAQGPGPIAPQGLGAGEQIFRVVDLEGTVWDGLGEHSTVPFTFPDRTGFVTVRSAGGEAWRLHNQQLVSAEAAPVGWLQSARSLESVYATLGSVRAQLFLGVPIAVALASVGGLFLADRGLRPIDRLTRTAQTMTDKLLHHRIGYRGPNDEVGRLATTFDAMLDRLEKAFERERRFTADASHELRTPLTALKGRLDVALSRPRSPVEYEDTLRRLDEEVGRLIRLSDELLFLARLEQSWPVRPPEVVDLSSLIEAVVDQMRPLAQSKQQTLLAEVPEGITVQGNPDYLMRLFLNLVDNAWKYTPPGEARSPSRR